MSCIPQKGVLLSSNEYLSNEVPGVVAHIEEPPLLGHVAPVLQQRGRVRGKDRGRTSTYLTTNPIISKSFASITS